MNYNSYNMKTNELSRAAQNLIIYVRNEREIYERYTLAAVEKVAAMIRSNATHLQQFDITPHGVANMWEVKRAISMAAGLERKYDRMFPTLNDKKTAAEIYAADIIDKAQHQIINEKKENLKYLKRELQNYLDNASYGVSEIRRRNIILLRWDIRKLERELQNA